MMFQLDDVPRRSARMRVIGVGGAGGNAVNRMIDEELEGVEFISANTDAQALAMSKATQVIQLGKKLTRGLGAGARPGIGRQAVAEDADDVRSTLEGADLVFIAAGMGGGTGTGAAPVIGEMARELGALTVAVVTRPFAFEGKKRMRQAEQGLAELRRTVDTMVVVPNDRLLAVVGKGTSFQDALKKADEVLLHATQGISDLIRVSGDVNVDFADVRTIMSSCGAALMGTGIGRGENRALSAAQDAVTSPLLDNVSIRGAKGVLINITGGSDLAIDEVTDISTMIQEEAGDDAEIIFGAVQDSTMEGEIRVTLIATGFDDNPDRQSAGPVIRPKFGSRRQRQAITVQEQPEMMREAVGGSPLPRMTTVTPVVDSARGVAPNAATMQHSFRSNAETQPAHAGPTRGSAAGGGFGASPETSSPRGGAPRARPRGARTGTGDMFRVQELELPTFIRRFNA